MVSILPLNHNQDDNKEDNQKYCQVCGGKCTTRCSRCQLVYYCQLECQRLDWTDGGHRKTCKGNQIKQRRQRQQRKRRCKSQFGPSLPPPLIVRNELDAEHALKELRSIAVEALSTSSGEGSSSKTKTMKTKTKTASIISGQKEKVKSEKTKSSLSTSVTTTTTSSSTRIESTTTSTATMCSTPKTITTTEKISTNEVLKNPTEKKKEKNSLLLSLPSPSSSDSQLSDDDKDEDKDEDEDENDDKNKVASSFVVEEMSQICTYQLTLKKIQLKQSLSFNKKYYDDRFNDEGSIVVTAKPIGQSGTSTLIMISYDKKSAITTTSSQDMLLFVGEFPCPIDASDITWKVVKSNDNDDDDNGVDDNNAGVVIVFRLRYPYDPLDNNNISGDTYSASSSTCLLRDINSVMCGSCYQPLLMKKSSNNNNNKHNCDNDNDSLSSFSSSFVIHRVFPLPVGHWDEISDYLICYDGQPAVDFSAGARCAEPSVALQDANCLCLHRNDVEMAICALAVDGYGELTGRDNDYDYDKDNDSINSDKNDDSKTDLLSSSSFMLPKGVNYFEPSSSSSSSTERKEKAKDSAFNPKLGEDSIGEKNSSSSSAAVRGDRIWQSATDGESVSLCCGRCCSPLGFTSLESPDTWRFWKHRLSIPLTKKSEENKNDDIIQLKYNSSPFLNRSKYPYMPLGSCSSFLARELVRYAESKAIFTFLVRCEDNTGMEEINKCLLLRLLSWETTMATSFKESSCLSQYSNSYSDNDSRRRQYRLNFRRVAKIVFEETIDPTVKDQHSTHNNSSTTQWFWGGVDLCCLPPPSNNDQNTTGVKANSTSNDVDDATILKPASTVKLQLSQEEYDQVLSDLVFGRSYFTKEMAEATVMIKMGGLSKGLGLTAVVL